MNLSLRIGVDLMDCKSILSEWERLLCYDRSSMETKSNSLRDQMGLNHLYGSSPSTYTHDFVCLTLSENEIRVSTSEERDSQGSLMKYIWIPNSSTTEISNPLDWVGIEVSSKMQASVRFLYVARNSPRDYLKRWLYLVSKQAHMRSEETILRNFDIKEDLEKVIEFCKEDTGIRNFDQKVDFHYRLIPDGIFYRDTRVVADYFSLPETYLCYWLFYEMQYIRANYSMVRLNYQSTFSNNPDTIQL